MVLNSAPTSKSFTTATSPTSQTDISKSSLSSSDASPTESDLITIISNPATKNETKKSFVDMKKFSKIPTMSLSNYQFHKSIRFPNSNKGGSTSNTSPKAMRAGVRQDIGTKSKIYKTPISPKLSTRVPLSPKIGCRNQMSPKINGRTPISPKMSTKNPLSPKFSSYRTPSSPRTVHMSPMSPKTAHYRTSPRAAHFSPKFSPKDINFPPISPRLTRFNSTSPKSIHYSPLSQRTTRFQIASTKLGYHGSPTMSPRSMGRKYGASPLGDTLTPKGTPTKSVRAKLPYLPSSPPPIKPALSIATIHSNSLKKSPRHRYVLI